MRFQVRLAGWQLLDSSHARQRSSLHCISSSTGSSSDQKHQHHHLLFVSGASARPPQHSDSQHEQEPEAGALGASDSQLCSSSGQTTSDKCHVAPES